MDPEKKLREGKKSRNPKRSVIKVATSKQYTSAGAGGKDSPVTGAFKRLFSPKKKARDSGISDLSVDRVEDEPDPG